LAISSICPKVKVPDPIVTEVIYLFPLFLYPFFANSMKSINKFLSISAQPNFTRSSLNSAVYPFTVICGWEGISSKHSKLTALIAVEHNVAYSLLLNRVNLCICPSSLKRPKIFSVAP
jgi:hypothetical protein